MRCSTRTSAPELLRGFLRRPDQDNAPVEPVRDFPGRAARGRRLPLPSVRLDRGLPLADHQAGARAGMTERGAQHGDAATEILGNALRLYSDAKLLFENGRFASCASLSVLAIEELAKFRGDDRRAAAPCPQLAQQSRQAR